MQLLLSVRSSEVLQKLLMILAETWRSTETDITIWAEVTGHLSHTRIKTYFAPPFICWKVLRKVPFYIAQRQWLIWGSPTFPSRGKVTNKLLCQVNVKGLQGSLCMVGWLLFQNKTIKNTSVNKIKQNSTPPFLSRYRNGIVGFHLIILVNTTHACMCCTMRSAGDR